MAGPPKQFDTDEALRKALETFWSKGYEATSMCDLVSHMGVNRASLYDTFGNKQALFRQTLERYAEDSLRAIAAVLEAPGSPLANIERYLGVLLQTQGPGLPNGCYISNTAVELGPHDRQIAEKIRDFWSRLEALVKAALERALKAGEISPRTDTASLARFCNTFMQGMAVKIKAGVDADELADGIQTVMAVLRLKA